MSRLMRVINKNPVAKMERSVSRIRKTSSFRSESSAIARVLFLQRTIGNRAVQKLIKTGTLQTKLRIGQPGDKYEQEADRVADAVMRMPFIQKVCPGCEEEELKRQPLEEEEEEELQKQPMEEYLMTKADNTAEIATDLESSIQALRGGGRPLSESMRTFFEPRFGHDFSHVRLHTGAQANELAQGVNARAFTIGSDVVFGAGQYSPDTMVGKRLLAHELTHVLQQVSMKGVDRVIDQQLMVQMSIADAFTNYRGTCDCGEDLGNNCAHYLSDAFIRAGYNDLDGGVGALYRRHNGRVVCKAGRPVRAREMRDWFAGMATATSNGEPDDNQYWAVYQHDGYPGGHVVIHNHIGKSYTWRGTGDYPAWGTQDHYTW